MSSSSSSAPINELDSGGPPNKKPKINSFSNNSTILLTQTNNDFPSGKLQIYFQTKF